MEYIADNAPTSPKWFYGDLIKDEDTGFTLAGEPTPIDVDSLSIEMQAILEVLEQQMGTRAGPKSIDAEKVDAIVTRKKRERRRRGGKVKDSDQDLQDRPLLYRCGDSYVLIAEPPPKPQWYSVERAGTSPDGTPLYTNPVPVDPLMMGLEARCGAAVLEEELEKAEKKLAEIGLDPDGAMDTLDLDELEAKVQEKIRQAKQVN
jgi:hypothetical protein